MVKDNGKVDYGTFLQRLGFSGRSSSKIDFLKEITSVSLILFYDFSAFQADQAQK